ncbi:MAG: aspartyl/glutamyl-tRNA amidotransferase subunit A [Candidatus Woykebacteria bacterium RIFCSPHIGHO2_12_FULL_45_10]|uniref:Glutamyl-tRNA(Gln) amidotransferase subunit A n=1 Tax=Candidatus Woykebacteria bacterium RIFCSPHIGHO2_12_FULL_45_10 TaxID=1802603 RepID=A0A1G1WQ35_9BACT|nr:MAG: aspartyl/glutamyl-tRNA amidotransferase subunit A [Candidatus Woykebacteria bacterium RIFCSPHIGHO2_12_FULL_45_10]
MELTKLTLREADEALKERKISSKELTEAHLLRIAEKDKQLGAYLTLTAELALEQAEKADQRRKNEEVCWLTGVPAAIKDIISTKNVRTTAGSKILEDYTPVYSATAYQRLEDVTTVLLGKTNLDEFAMGASTENSALGKTVNPWDLERVPGGSSGGSAAAVAADLATFALGTDTGGSIRQPASFCNVVGLKPTYGRVSRYGVIAMASSLDQVGPIAKTVEDAALVLNIIAGHDKYDSTSAKKELPDFTKFLGGKVKGMKIGVPKEFFGKGLQAEVKTTVEGALAKLEELGASLIDVSLPTTKEAVAVYYLIMPSEVSANLARYDGIRFGKTRENFGAEVKRRIMLGTYALSAGYYDAYYLKAAKVRRVLFNELQEVFKRVDVIAGPTSPVLPFKFGEKTADPLSMYLADIYTVTANLAGIPAISVPAGFAKGLPVGLQLQANHWEEGKLLKVAHAFEQATGFSKEKPKL